MPAEPSSRSSAGDVADVLARAADVEREIAEHAVPGARNLVGKRRGGCRQRLGVGHLEHGRDPAEHSRAAARLEVLLVLEPRLAEVHLGVDDAGQDMQAAGVDRLCRGGRSKLP